MSDVIVGTLSWEGGQIVRHPKFKPVKKRLADIMLKNAAKSKQPEVILESDLAKWKAFFHPSIGTPVKVTKEEGIKAVQEAKIEKEAPVVDPVIDEDPIMEDVSNEIPSEEQLAEVDAKFDQARLDELMKKAKPELRKLAGEAGLETEGTKVELANRIVNNK